MQPRNQGENQRVQLDNVVDGGELVVVQVQQPAKRDRSEGNHVIDVIAQVARTIVRRVHRKPNDGG
jgi:hypothetical protein